MKVFLDAEFTGLHRDTTIISLGAVAEDGETFYRELNDYNDGQADDWIRSNVLPHLNWQKDSARWSETVSRYQLMIDLEQWFEQVGAGNKIEIWLDAGAYDWMLLCDLWGNAQKVPSIVHYMPRDLSTYFEVMGIDPDVSREQFADMAAPPEMGAHHALWDALMIKACYDKLHAAQHQTEDEAPPPDPEDAPDTEEDTEIIPPPEDEQSQVDTVEAPGDDATEENKLENGEEV